ncbi:MAG: IclR family transcriptional regulator C-terminal domain-containing protein [Pseudomonadota bacterium]
MPRIKTIRSLERGLRVLKSFQSQPNCALQDLHRSTKIPKATLLRILETLQRAGMVTRRLGDGRYRISSDFLQIAPRSARYSRVTEIAGPVLDRLCRKVLWPSDLMLPAGDHLQIAETSQAVTPFNLKVSPIGAHVNYLMSAVGRAYLAYCPDKEREEILRRLRKSRKLVDRLARDPKRFERILEETRKRGYGLRDPSFGGGPYGREPIDEGVSAIAVPLRDGKQVHGAINILWIRTAHSIEDFAAMHFRDLQSAAAEIVATLREPAR